jgi:hypothetical protein
MDVDENTPPVTDTASLPSEQHAPRTVTARTRRYARGEPRVRLWLLLASLASAVTIYLFVSHLLRASHDDWLRREGREVVGSVFEVDADRAAKQEYTDNTVRAVIVRYEVNGQQFSGSVMLTPASVGSLKIGAPRSLRINPNDASDFTIRTSPASLFERTAAGLMVLPIAIGTVGIAGWKWRSLLRTWRDGELVSAIVLSRSTAGIAPSAWAVTCTPVDAVDNRVFKAYVPRSQAKSLARGDLLWLIGDSITERRAGAVVAAAWFDRGDAVKPAAQLHVDSLP